MTCASFMERRWIMDWSGFENHISLTWMVRLDFLLGSGQDVR